MSETSAPPEGRAAPLIVGFVSDLMFTTRIEDVAGKLGFRVIWIERAEQLSASGGNSPGISVAAAIAPAPDAANLTTSGEQPKLFECLHGPGALLLDRLTAWQPALLIFDLGNPFIPWREWIALLKTAPATRRIPVLSYGSHVYADTLQAAKSAGADAALARSRFTTDLPALIQKYARLPDYAAIHSACAEPLSETALHGLELFNHGEYFEAHEALEAAWNADPSPGRELYRAILQVAVAYLQIERGNYNGAAKMFLRLRQWLAPLPDECRGVDVARLRLDAAQVEAALLRLGPEQVGEFDSRLFRPVVFLRS